MKILIKSKPLTQEWQPFFAWYPVFCSEGIFWLESVEYQWDGSGYDPGFNYRAKRFSK